MAYAQNTTVPVDRTISAIQAMIQKFGAEQFGLFTSQNGAIIGFVYRGRAVKFELELPDRNDRRYQETPTGRIRRNPNAPLAAWESECRAKWRSLHLFIKALFVAVEDGLIEFDRAFFHDIVTPDGKTIGQRLLGEVKEICEKGAKKFQLQLTGGD